MEDILETEKVRYVYDESPSLSESFPEVTKHHTEAVVLRILTPVV